MKVAIIGGCCEVGNKLKSFLKYVVDETFKAGSFSFLSLGFGFFMSLFLSVSVLVASSAEMTVELSLLFLGFLLFYSVIYFILIYLVYNKSRLYAFVLFLLAIGGIGLELLIIVGLFLDFFVWLVVFSLFIMGDGR